MMVNTSQKDSVNTRHRDYSKHLAQVELVNKVYEGVDSMSDLMFRFPQETNATFLDRVSRATLRNFVKRAIEAFTGMIFRKPIEFSGYPARMTRLFQTIDTANSLSSFTKKITTDVAKDGSVFILVDAPVDGGVPYLTEIARSQVINWRKDHLGKHTMLVIEEMIEIPDGEFGTKYIEQWRHFKDDGTITLHRKLDTPSKRGEIVLYDVISSDYIGIPVVEIKIDETPILYDTAKLNVKHFNRLSHKDRYLTMAALPIPIIWGADIDDTTGEPSTAKPALVIGVDEAFIFNGTKDECDFQWRELSGTSIGLLEDDLNSITEDITTGILRAADSANTVQKSATEVALLQAEASDRVSSMALAVEVGMTRALEILAVFTKETITDTSKFVISKDFTSALAGTDGQRVVMEAYLQGLVSIETFLQSLADAELISIESTTNEISRIEKDTFVPQPKIHEKPKTDNRLTSVSADIGDDKKSDKL